jgi:hypothetical protein
MRKSVFGSVLFLSLSVSTLCFALPAMAFEEQKQPPAATEHQPLRTPFVLSMNPSGMDQPPMVINYDQSTFVQAAIVEDPKQNSFLPRPKDIEDGTMGIAEVGYANKNSRLGIGGFQYKEKDQFIPFGAKRVNGMYVLAEQKLYEEGDKSVTGFARVGKSAGDLAEGANGWSTGFALNGFVKDRPEGQFVVALSGSRGNSLGLLPGDGGMESRIELGYRDKISENVTIAPGIRYTVNPDYAPDEDRDLSFGVRLNVKFK